MLARCPMKSGVNPTVILGIPNLSTGNVDQTSCPDVKLTFSSRVNCLIRLSISSRLCVSFAMLTYVKTKKRVRIGFHMILRTTKDMIGSFEAVLAKSEGSPPQWILLR